jgi:outer membrane protein OmpA-like peptidoglycan-associated protein
VETVEAPTLTASLAPTVVQLEPVAREPLIVVDFQRASQRVTHRAQQLLEAAAPLLGSSGQVTVVGHADATGSDDLNDRLSEERAHSVARRLFMLGVRAVRVRIEARGAREPRDDGSDRRVEVFLGDGP